MVNVKPELFAKKIFVARNAAGAYSFYDSDPMRGGAECDLAAMLADAYGEPDAVNPVMIQIQGALMQRGGDFDCSVPEKINRGLDAHLEDYEGSLVVILPYKSADNAHPFEAVVLDEEGRVADHRTYTLRGDCSDGVTSHQLAVITGRISFDGLDGAAVGGSSGGGAPVGEVSETAGQNPATRVGDEDFLQGFGALGMDEI